MHKKIYYFIENNLTFFMRIILSIKRVDYNIPVYINNFNRLKYLKILIKKLESLGYTNINIIDNNSTYEPLLLYYQNECKYRVIKLNKNKGHLSLWKSWIYLQLLNSYYIYTDPDVVPCDDIPENFVETIINKMQSNNRIYKIGLSLRIDDLPDSNKNKDNVIEWESKWWKCKTNGMYKAHVDTTFAIYAPWSWGGSNEHRDMYRMDRPFSAHHLPWYENSNEMTEENSYYRNSLKTKTHWSGL